jgi:hypothetical protein
LPAHRTPRLPARTPPGCRSFFSNDLRSLRAPDPTISSHRINRSDHQGSSSAPELGQLCPERTSLGESMNHFTGTILCIACCTSSNRRRLNDGYGNKRNRFPYRQR